VDTCFGAGLRLSQRVAASRSVSQLLAASRSLSQLSLAASGSLAHLTPGGGGAVQTSAAAACAAAGAPPLACSSVRSCASVRAGRARRTLGSARTTYDATYCASCWRTSSRAPRSAAPPYWPTQTTRERACNAAGSAMAERVARARIAERVCSCHALRGVLQRGVWRASVLRSARAGVGKRANVAHMLEARSMAIHASHIMRRPKPGPSSMRVRPESSASVKLVYCQRIC
jgi:hypothetical protein